MKSGQTTRRERFLPYRYEPFGLTLRLERCTLDGGRAIESFNVERHLVDLSELKLHLVDLELHVEVTATLLERVFPPGERDPAPADLVLAVRCAATHLRRRVVLGAGTVAAGRHAARLTLARDDVYGSVELVPLLLRSGQGGAGTDGYAALAGARVASSRPWEVRFDLLRAAGGAYLDVRYVSFSQHGREQFPWPETLYQLECAGENPILWLNTDHDRVYEVLNNQANVGLRARLREVFFDGVSHAVWTRLFLSAARAAAAPEGPPFEWQHSVLAQLLPALYPQEVDHESRLAALRHELGDGDEAVLLERLDAALQVRFDTAGHLQRLAEEVE